MNIGKKTKQAFFAIGITEFGFVEGEAMREFLVSLRDEILEESAKAIRFPTAGGCDSLRNAMQDATAIAQKKIRNLKSKKSPKE